MKETTAFIPAVTLRDEVLEPEIAITILAIVGVSGIGSPMAVYFRNDDRLKRLSSCPVNKIQLERSQ